MIDFRSDNVHTIADPVLKEMIEANKNTVASYGGDELTKSAKEMLSEIFNTQIDSFFVSTGTAANSLSLASITPEYGTIFCGSDSHIYLEECNAPEFFSNSAKLYPVKTKGGKIIYGELEKALLFHPSDEFDMVASSLSISQATEAGTIYTQDEIKNLKNIADSKKLKIHMDGARFANVVAAMDKKPQELTWEAGVDVMSFGTTKNGTMSAEAVIFFNTDLSNQTNLYMKRSGHLLSKMRFISSQIIGYLKNNLWIELARSANKKANLLSQNLSKFDFIHLPWQTEINEVFIIVPKELEDYLRNNEISCHNWTKISLDEQYHKDNYSFLRLVTSFNTDENDIYKVVEIIENF